MTDQTSLEAQSATAEQLEAWIAQARNVLRRQAEGTDPGAGVAWRLIIAECELEQERRLELEPPF